MGDPAMWCCVCLFNGAQTEAMTVVKGYRVCQAHLSFREEFFRRWEAVQDPKQLPNKTKKKLKKGSRDVAS